MNNAIKIFLILLLSTYLYAEDGLNCFTIIAGKNCTMDGSILFGHNEDDTGDMIVNMYKVPALSHSTSELVTLKNGGKYKQFSRTNSYIWLEMPGMEFSDGYLNEYGVVLASNNCPSREDSADISDGGIGYWFRRLMAERAKTAREAVEIGGKLVEKFGYTQPGRSYCIADPNEAWVMSVVQGKHWVAQRIPDDKVMLIPNYYVIEEIDLEDTENYLGSKDIINYAISRKWYNPTTDGVFNFRKIYGRKETLENPRNINRSWMALQLIADREYNIDDEFPFTITPNKKLDLADLFTLLRNHYDGTFLENRYKSKSPHVNQNRPICTISTQYAFVAHLRNNVPKELAGIMWYSPVQPCLHPFVPVYFSTTKFPEEFAYQDYNTGLKLHFDPNYVELKNFFDNHAFISFANFSNWVNEDFYNRSPEVMEHFAIYEKENIEKHIYFDLELQQEYKKSPKNAQKMLDKYGFDNLKMLISVQHD